MLADLVEPRQRQLQHLAQVLEQVERLVDRPHAGGWELGVEPVVQVGGAGMPVAGRQQAQQGDALRGQPVPLLPEPPYKGVEPGLWIGHRLTAFSFQNGENHSL